MSFSSITKSLVERERERYEGSKWIRMHIVSVTKVLNELEGTSQAVRGFWIS